MIVFSHRGIDCAFPSSQVKQTVPLRETDETVALFAGSTHDAGEHDRALLVRTADGDRFVPCLGARIETFEDSALLEMPVILRDVLRMPHLVGIARGARITWLVDASRLVGAEASRLAGADDRGDS